jgi:hypothetical protein
MKVFLMILALAVVLSGRGTASAEAAENGSGSVNGQVSELQEKMLKDTEIMGLIQALQNDPQMQELLEDPSVMSAVINGDIATLTGNPRFMHLLENARVKEIQKRLEP